MRRPSSLFLLSLLAVAPLLLTGCGPQTVMPFTAEADDPDYRRAKELLRMGREQEALAQFLRLIDQRGGAAAESHLEAGILYHKHIKDPIAAIYHYRRYRELRPGTEQARLVLQSIEACIRDFARTLPAQPLDNQVERTDLMDAIDRLQRENLQLKEQLAGARAAVLDTTRQAAAGEGLTVSPGLDVEPSQGGYVTDAPATGLAGRGAEPEYSAPVGVSPVPITPAPTPFAAPAPTPPAASPAAPAPAAGVRRHVVAKGDTLQSISLRYYGTRSRFRDIYAANRDVMPNEGTLRIGMELKIPQ
jgi:tetratricopeptide (TPR) repeat protein